MHSFTDKAGRPWQLVLDTDTIRRVRDLLKINIAVEAANGSLFDRLELDPVLLADVLFAICKPQVDAAKVSSEDFGRALAGDVIQQATEALIEELLDFFPSGPPAGASGNAEHRPGGPESGAETTLRRDGDRRPDPISDDTFWGWIDDLAGILGIDPGRFTLRRLTNMARSRLRTEWDRTAALLELLYAANKTKEAPQMTADDLNPFATGRRGRSSGDYEAPITVLKALLPVDKR